MRSLFIAVLLLVPACDGPKEDAGEQADFEAGVVNSEDTLRSGPAETLGEKQDEADQARNAAVEARADALDAAAAERRAAAAEQAQKLEGQADAVRSQ